MAVYLYALGRATDFAAASWTTEPIQVVSVGELVALIAEVPTDAYAVSEPPTDEEQQTRIAQVVRHDAIVVAAHERGPVVPVRFGAIFSSDATLLAWLEPQLAQVQEFLVRLIDHGEWVVRAKLDVDKAVTWLLETHPAWTPQYETLPASPGARYLQEKRLRTAAEPAARQAAQEVTTAMLRQLSDGLTMTELPPRAGEIVAAAVLVPRERFEQFAELPDFVEPLLGPTGVSVSVTGPWPAFHNAPTFGVRS
jgi:hypothetical protein